MSAPCRSLFLVVNCSLCVTKILIFFESGTYSKLCCELFISLLKLLLIKVGFFFNLLLYLNKDVFFFSDSSSSDSDQLVENDVQ